MRVWQRKEELERNFYKYPNIYSYNERLYTIFTRSNPTTCFPCFFYTKSAGIIL